MQEDFLSAMPISKLVFFCHIWRNTDWPGSSGTVLLIHFKKSNMYYNQSCAAKGYYGNRQRQLFNRSMQRAAVNIYKSENSYEMLVFAPGRIKEHFKLDVEGRELK